MLTDKTIRSLKPKAKQYEVGDGKVQGLALRVLPSGSRTWSYRYRVGRGWRRVSLGPFPAVGLADARKLAENELLKVKQGGDPSREKRERREADTFGDLMERYLDRHALGPAVGPRQTRNSATVRRGALLAADGTEADIWSYEVREGEPKKRSWRVDRHLLATETPRNWRLRPAADITRRDVRELIETKATDAPIQANRLRALLHKLFNFALEQDMVQLNPVFKTPRPGTEQQRQRVLSQEEIRAFWSCTDGMEPAMRAFWRLRLVTAQRSAEVNTMRWKDLDLDNALWTIPAGRSKNKLAHRVPLSKLALELLSTLPIIDDFVLAGARGKRQQSQAAKLIPVADFRGHDLRRTAASFMASVGVPRLHIGKVLNHAERGVTAVYDRHGYDAEKRAALEGWSRKLAVILDLFSDEGAVIVAFPRG